MNSNSRLTVFGALLASAVLLPFHAFGQEPASNDQKADATVATPAAVETPAPAAPGSGSPSAPELRRLDGPPPADAPAEPAPEPSRVRRGNVGSGERIALGHDVQLEQDGHADSVVAIFGSATSAGEVDDTVGSVIGDTRVTGPVGDTVWAVLGSTYVNSRVGRDVVAVMGNVELGADAEVKGDVVAIGGRVTRDPKATVRGDVRNIGVGPVFSAQKLEWLLAWIRECGIWGRMLWIAPHLEWAWALAMGALFVYVMLAVLFRGGIEKGVKTIETRPGSSVVAAILTTLLAPVMIVLLCLTVIGIALVPFALLIAVIFGEAIILAWLGRRVTRLFHETRLDHPAVSVLVGGVIVLALYMIPAVGILTFKVSKILGVGVVVLMIVNNSRRERPVAVAAESASDAGSMAGGGLPAAPSPIVVGTVASAETDPIAAPRPPSPPPLAVPVDTLPRAGFWIRTGALLLDLILVGVVVMFLGSLLHNFFQLFPGYANGRHHSDGPQGLLLGLAVYGALMWKSKGTTIGGIICGLKVVRTDGRPIDWPTAVVRALSCFLSLMVVGLGFFWVVIDDVKLSWHDKIAGTAVVRVPRGMALV
jgi:uncharacterized RDD family membrane protein YckC